MINGKFEIVAGETWFPVKFPKKNGWVSLNQNNFMILPSYLSERQILKLRNKGKA